MSTNDEAIKNAVKDTLPSLASINAKYYENPDQFIADAKANPDAVLVEVTVSSSTNLRIFQTTDRKAASLACTIKNRLVQKSSSFAPTMSATNSNQYPNLVNKVSLRIEINQESPYSEAIKTIAEGLKEYFR